MLTRADIEAIAAICRERGLWLISDEAYEDVLFDGAEHVSAASLPGMYERTISVFTFSKSYAMTGLRLGYVVCSDAAGARADEEGALLYRQQRHLNRAVSAASARSKGRRIRSRRSAPSSRRGATCSTTASASTPATCSPASRRGRVLRVPAHRSMRGERAATGPESRSWAMAEHLIARGRIGCVPGVDFGANGEGYIRFCFARERTELTGALESMRAVFAQS